MKKRKVYLKGCSEPKSSGFKKIINEVDLPGNRIRVEANMTIRRGQFSLYAAENKLGYKIGDFIKFVDRKSLDAMGKNKQIRLLTGGRVECVRYCN